MGRLPQKALFYYWVILLVSGLTFLWSLVSYRYSFAYSPLGFCCLLFLAFVAGSRKVQVIRGAKEEGTGSMSLGFVAFFSTLLLYGPVCGVWAAIVSCLSSCFYPRRQAAFQLVFNVALTVLVAWYAGLAFFLTNHHSLQITPHSMFPVLLATLVYFLLNTLGVAAIIGFCSHQNPLTLWKDKFLWTIPSYLAGAAVITLSVSLFQGQFVVHFLLSAPIAYLMYQSYAVYIARAEERQEYIEELQINQAHLSDLYGATVKSMALAIGAKDPYTHQHILRVQGYALGIADAMGLAEAEREAIKTGALLHDIGKLGVPEHILLKPGRLTEEEYAKIKKHPEIGAAILDPVNFPGPVVSAVKHHHERWDGTGYPDGLSGEEIPMPARILAIADVYDALTTPRPYRNAWTQGAAIEYIREKSGIYFDPMIVQNFLEVIERVGTEETLVSVAEVAAETPCKALGALAIVSAQPVQGTTKADQAARDIQRASAEVWTLYQIAESISNCFSLEDTLNILADKLLVIFPGTNCLLLLQDKSDHVLNVRTARGRNQRYFENGRAGPGSRSLTVALTRRTYVGGYDAADLEPGMPADQEWIALQSALIVPIIHQGEVLGTINLYHPDADYFTPYYCELLETITERAARALYNGHLFDRTRSHAITDPLTGLYNVRYVAQHVEQCCLLRETESEVEARLAELTQNALRENALQPDVDTGAILNPQTEHFALLCLDLDSFKPINDNYGHQKGDQVLKDLSALFRSMVRDKDIVARYGGDEFLIVIQATSPAEANALAARLQEAVEQYDTGLMHSEIGALRLGVSIGYACYPLDGSDYPSLLAIADSRMYSNKTARKLRMMAQSHSSVPLSPDVSAMALRLPECEISHAFTRLGAG